MENTKSNYNTGSVRVLNHTTGLLEKPLERLPEPRKDTDDVEVISISDSIVVVELLDAENFMVRWDSENVAKSDLAKTFWETDDELFRNLTCYSWTCEATQQEWHAQNCYPMSLFSEFRKRLNAILAKHSKVTVIDRTVGYGFFVDKIHIRIPMTRRKAKDNYEPEVIPHPAWEKLFNTKQSN